MLSLICTRMSVHSSSLDFKNIYFLFNLSCAENSKQLLEVSCPNHHPLRAQTPLGILSTHCPWILWTLFVLDTTLLFNQFSTPCSLCSLNPAKANFPTRRQCWKQNFSLVWGIGRLFMIWAKINILCLIWFFVVDPPPPLAKRSWAVPWLSVYSLFHLKRGEVQN